MAAETQLADGSSFAVTRWSIVLRAGCGESTGWRDSMAQLFQAYWKPLYAYCRRRGVAPERASDLLQGFFTHLIERRSLRHAEQARGRFRSFLLTCFRNYMSDQSDRDRAEKRGGGQRTIALDLGDAESALAATSADALSPERAFQRRWALTLLDEAMLTLREEQRAAGKADQFAQIEPLLAMPGERGATAAIAERLGLTDNALRVTLHRLRRRFREILRAQVLQTVADPADVEDELRELLMAIRGE